MPKSELRHQSVEARVDTQVSVVGLLRQLGVNVPDIEYGSVKVYCPFGILHPDHGITRAMRVYPESNTAFCFSDCGHFTPTKLAAQAWDLSREDAADRLMDQVEAETPLPVEDLFQVGAGRPSGEALSEALRVYCQRQNGWSGVEFTSEVVAKLGRCLDLLPGVVSPQDASKWLEGSKVVMERAVRRASDGQHS
jgi:hypothetical protein